MAQSIVVFYKERRGAAPLLCEKVYLAFDDGGMEDRLILDFGGG